MKQLDDLNKATKEIYDYFGYTETWDVYPIDDRRNYWWGLRNARVHFYDTKEAYIDRDGMHSYTNQLMHSNSVFKGAEYTMILVDTRTDGNKFLAIYDNSKRLSIFDDVEEE